MTAPEMSAPSAQPDRVIAGRTACRSACTSRTAMSPMPRVRAVVMKGWASTFSNSSR